MEISNEIKARVFAQYSFQYLQCVIKTGKHWQQRSFLQEVQSDKLIVAGKSFPFSRHINFDECKLILKPLSTISDEDAIEVAKICEVTDSDFHTDQFSDYKGEDVDGNAVYGYNLVGRHYVKYLFLKGQRVWHPHPNVFISVYQYLQANGYDLPMWQLGGKTLKEAGLAVYE